jgi:hypothetical protein
MISLKKIRAILLLICALAVPVPSPAEDYSDMFSVMFRMMLIMMNGMSDAMLDNSNVAGWDTGNSFDFGMTTLPMMSGMSGINPVSGFGGVPGMSPWSGMNPATGFGGMPGMSPWSGMNPATGFGGMPGMSPWSVPFNNNSWTYPYTNTYPYNANPYNANNPYANRGYAGYPPAQTSLLGGKWYGNAGEILQIRGNRFRLQDGQTGINGTIRIENNIVSLYCPQTGTVSQYTFIRNQSELLLQDPSGQVLMFTQQPIRGSAHTF